MIEPILAEEEQKFDDIGSFNHALVLANLAYLLNQAGNFSVFTRLSLDTTSQDLSQYGVRDEMIPDVCLYDKRKIIPFDDILRMSEMPQLVIEVLSLREKSPTLIQKIKAYFALGVQSCWLIDPSNQRASVYRDVHNRETFLTGNLIDKKIGIKIPLREIFD